MLRDLRWIALPLCVLFSSVEQCNIRVVGRNSCWACDVRAVSSHGLIPFVLSADTWPYYSHLQKEKKWVLADMNRYLKLPVEPFRVSIVLWSGVGDIHGHLAHN